jgi:hypothetical protein
MLYMKIFIFQIPKATKEKHDEKQCSIFTRPDKKSKQRQRRKPSKPIIDTNKVLLNLKYKRNVYEYKESGKRQRKYEQKKMEVAQREKKKVSIPSNAALATGPDGTRHLHELFLVHGGGDGVAQNTFSHRYAHERRERQRRRPSLFRAALTRSIPPGSPAILPITTH